MKKLFLLLPLFSTALFAQDESPCQVVADPYQDCRRGITYLNATPGFDSYQWSPAALVSNPNIANPTTTTPATYTVTASTVIGPELVVNGDFSAGATGFISGHTLSAVYSPCNYFVGPGWFSAVLDPNFPDNTPTADNMFMSVDGCSPATILWEETMAITSFTDYTFSFHGSRADQVQPIYEIHFIGDVTGDVIVSTQNGIPYTGVWAWDKYSVTCWNAGENRNVTIRIVNLETNGYGNDFGMDDFSFRQCCTSSFTVYAPGMYGANLFVNGDFSLGNTGFISGHNYSSVYTPGNYFVGPGWFSSTYDPNTPDHTLTSDNMYMSVDGASPATVLWEQTVTVTPFTIYQFSFWATQADLVQPIYEIHFIGNATGDVIVSIQNGIPYSGSWTWDQYMVNCWDADKNTSLTVRIINLETAGNGNDFAMDDFSIRECCYPQECCHGGPNPNRVAKPAPSAFSVFPNPSSGTFSIQFEDAVENAQVEIFNVLGEKVDAFTISGTMYTYCPAEKLAAGVYVLRVTHNGEQKDQELIIE